MKIIVMSDTHRDTKSIEYMLTHKADHYFHCGDSELPFDHPLLANMTRVRGNCDVDNRFPLDECIEIGEKKICLAHGHEHQVNLNMNTLYYYGAEQRADIVLFGHTHLFGAEQSNDILLLNPGSPVAPRGGNEPTFAVITINDKVHVQFYNMQNVVVKEAFFK